MPFERAKAALSGTRFADLRWVQETGSTNADVAEILRSGGPSTGRGAVVLIADHQVAGRGRRDRTWEARPGSSLLMSIGLPVGELDPQRWSLLNAAVALAAVDAAPDLRIKWPNDLVAPGAGESGADLKVGGILAELHHDVGDRGPCIVIGLGLNLNWVEMPGELADTATSLDILLGGDVDPDVIVADLLIALDSRWLALLADASGGPDELLAAYRSRSATLGRTVKVELDAGSGGDVLTGTADDIDATGALLVMGTDGRRHTVTVGDVVHARPLD